MSTPRLAMSEAMGKAEDQRPTWRGGRRKPPWEWKDMGTLTGKFSKMPGVDSKRKSSLLCNLRRDLSANMDSPWSTHGPNFINNKSLVSICWQRLLSYPVCQEEPQTELSAPTLFSTCLHHLSNHCKESLVSSFYQWTEPCPIQSELHCLDTSFT